MTTNSLFDADHLLYVGELACLALLVVAQIILVFAVGWIGLVGGTFTFLLGMMFTILSNSRRDIHLIIKEKGETE